MARVHDRPTLQYNNGVILNEDDKGYSDYISNRNRALKQLDIDLAMKDRINSLEEELSQMKDMIRMILENKGA